jgi:type I restriction enzyme S subunit
MELKPGYKQTEIGVIPDDWEVVTLGKIATIHDGTHQTPRYVPSGIPFYSVEHVTSGDFSNTKFISEKEHQFLTRSLRIEKGDILMTRIGSIGDCILVDWDVNASFYVSLALLKVGGAHAPYLAQYSESATFKKEADLHSLPSATPKKINLGPISEIRIALPTDPVEQEKIAAVLSDVDALLAGLGRLIAKKRDLKQAAMQELLTGQTRLPGFSGPWQVKRMGDHVTFLRNGVNSRADLTLEDPVKYLHYGDIHACSGVMLEPSALPSLPSGKAKTLDRLRDGDLIFADASEDLTGVSKSVEVYGVGTTELVSGLHTIAARFDKNVLADGFKGYLQFCPAFAGQLRRLAAGTKVYATNRSHIASIEMKLPGPQEQTAIAAVLTDMDAEIAALEQRRRKTQDLKQALMQELLTGRTRLIPRGEAEGAEEKR